MRGDLRRRDRGRRRPRGHRCAATTPIRSAGATSARRATALADLHHDPDRLRRPLVRDGASWREVGWDEALDLVARAARARCASSTASTRSPCIRAIRRAHNLGLLTLRPARAAHARHAQHVLGDVGLDQLPHMLAALTMFGNQLLMPVPDVDRSDLFICLGANPLASNGSIMTAPDITRPAQGDPRARRQGRRARSAAHRDRGEAPTSTCSSGRAPMRCCCSR